MDDKLKPLYEAIGGRIRDARIKRGMSQQDLAEKANISLPQISVIERGKTQMYLYNFINIAEALKVSTDELLRPDVPEVNLIFQKEFGDLLSDCTPSQLDTIIKIVTEVKKSMKAKNEYEE